MRKGEDEITRSLKQGKASPLPALFTNACLGSNPNLPLTAEGGGVGGHCLTDDYQTEATVLLLLGVTAKTEGDLGTCQVPNPVSSTQSPFPQTKAPVLAVHLRESSLERIQLCVHR